MRKTISCFLLGAALAATAAFAAESPALPEVGPSAPVLMAEPVPAASLAALLAAPPVSIQPATAADLPWLPQSAAVGGSVCSCGYTCPSSCTCFGGSACCSGCCAAARCAECSSPSNPLPGCGFSGGGGGGNN